MTLEEAHETTKVHSISGLLPPGKALVATRPFQSPHHTISNVASVGGGVYPRPGDVTPVFCLADEFGYNSDDTQV